VCAQRARTPILEEKYALMCCEPRSFVGGAEKFVGQKTVFRFLVKLLYIGVL
jgi:hypothetical protein